MVHPADVEAISLGAVLGFHLEKGVEEKMVVLGKRKEDTWTDGEDLFPPVGDIVVIYTGIGQLFEIVTVYTHSQHFRDDFVFRGIVEMNRLTGLGSRGTIQSHQLSPRIIVLRSP